jgi:hypothetical protein
MLVIAMQDIAHLVFHIVISLYNIRRFYFSVGKKGINENRIGEASTIKEASFIHAVKMDILVII